MRNDYANEYADLYDRHWWWRTREAIVLDQIDQLSLDRKASLEVLDVGCGDGVLLPKLDRYGQAWGIEIDQSLITDHPYRDRIFTEPLGADIYQDKKYDLITALDVIEHIEDDTSAVCNMIHMLKPGGHLIITVPAFSILWDEHDEMNLHYRRYTKMRLRSLISSQGHILELRYLYASLFPLKLMVKSLNLLRRRKVAQHHLPSRMTNMLMTSLCSFEYALFGRMPLPIGTSVLAVIQKQNNDAKFHHQADDVELSQDRRAA